MTDRNQNKGQRPWLQWVTLGVASLAMVFSLITAFHPFGIGSDTSRPTMTQQSGGFGGRGSMENNQAGSNGNTSSGTTNSVDEAASNGTTTQ